MVFLGSVFGRGHREVLSLSSSPGERQARRVLRVVRALRRRHVGEGRRDRQATGYVLVQRHRERDRVALGGRGVSDRHCRRSAASIVIVVDDCPRRRIGRRHPHRSPRYRETDGEGLIRLHRRVLGGGDSEALRLPGGAGEGERGGVLGVVRALRRRHVGEARRHRQTAGHRLVQRHRERDRIAFIGRGILDRHRRIIRGRFEQHRVNCPRRRVRRRHRR